MRRKEPSSGRRRSRGAKSAGGSEAQYTVILDAIRDHIFETHQLPHMGDIERRTGLSRGKCRQICDILEGQKQVYTAFKGPKMPRIVVPYDMMQGILRTQSKPPWVKDFEFPEKQQTDKEIGRLHKQILHYEFIERLLYVTDIPLEEAVAYALGWLEFEDVQHQREDPNNPDVTFRYDGKLALVEVEGTTKAAEKDKAEQLGGWLQKAIAEDNLPADQLQGFVAVNHYRDKRPDEREAPLTRHAEQFLRLFSARFFTTRFLFEVAKDVMEHRLQKADAREKIWRGGQ